MSQSELNRTYFQDGLHDNHCYGCGAWNDQGLRIKSYWDGDEAVCTFQPEPHHAAMPPDVMNGGTIAAVIDCHGVCTSIAEAYKTEGRDIGDGKKIWYATASLTVNYRKPTPISLPSVLYASAIDVQTPWQSITAAIVPPFMTSGGIAA